MRYGYWLPVFGGWLRNVEDEGMEASWDYVSRLARRSEQFEDAGVDLLLLQCSPQLEEMERFAETVIQAKELVQAQAV